MQYARIAILSLSCLLSACVTTYPKNAEDQATYHASEAQAAIAKGNCTSAGRDIDVALSRLTGNAKIKELFSRDPKARDCYYAYHEKQIIEVSDASQATAAYAKLMEIKTAGILSESQTGALFAKLGKTVVDGNVTGSVPFVLGDNLDYFPELKSPSHQQIIVDRSVANLQKGSGVRPVAALMDYVDVAKVGLDSVEGKRIESLLPTMNIRRDEIDVVAKVFPKFATARRDEITARVLLQVKGDRLLTEDLRQVLRDRVRGVEWVPSAGPRTIALTIERVRNDEKVLPEQSQTITYAQHEVDTLSAVLLMPRNASYIYEVVSGGAEIEYGYVVSAITDGKPIYDELVRGKVGGQYQRCQNSRIQNVFGGTSSAGFMANDDMRQRCSGPSSASIEQLRQDIFSKIVDGVLKVPPIKLAHDLN